MPQLSKPQRLIVATAVTSDDLPQPAHQPPRGRASLWLARTAVGGTHTCGLIFPGHRP
jgi:hypothetical protein